MNKDNSGTKEKNVNRYYFRTNEKKTKDILNSVENKSEFIAKIIDAYCRGELLPIATAKKLEEIAEIKLRKDRATAIRIEIDAKLNMLRNMHMSPDEISQVMNNKKSPLDHNLPKDIILPDGRLRCFTCGKIFDLRAYPFMQVDDYMTHTRQTHNRYLFQNEKETLSVLYGEHLV